MRAIRESSAFFLGRPLGRRERDSKRGSRTARELVVAMSNLKVSLVLK